MELLDTQAYLILFPRGYTADYHLYTAGTWMPLEGSLRTLAKEIEARHPSEEMHSDTSSHPCRMILPISFDEQSEIEDLADALEDERAYRMALYFRARASIEVLSEEIVRNSVQKSRIAEVRCLGQIYHYSAGALDMSYGEAPGGQWIGSESIAPFPQSLVLKLDNTDSWIAYESLSSISNSIINKAILDHLHHTPESWAVTDL